MNLEAFLFAKAAALRLRTGTADHSNDGYYRVTGKLVTELTLAAVEIHVWNGPLLRQSPPRVWCRESWMRNDHDWHYTKGGGMCWVLEEQWTDEMNTKGATPIFVVEVGVLWLIAGVTSLVDRHLVGFRRNLRRWPAEWDAFAHFNRGAIQYEREKREERRKRR